MRPCSSLLLWLRLSLVPTVPCPLPAQAQLWTAQISILASLPNVFVKISGITEEWKGTGVCLCVVVAVHLQAVPQRHLFFCVTAS